MGGGGSGGGGPTTSTVNNVQIPDWLRPQTEAMLGAATQQVFRTEDVGGTPDIQTQIGTDEAGNPIYQITPGTPANKQITGFNNYTPYSANAADYVAGFSPMQQQSFQAAANLQVPGQFGQATNYANAAGMGGLGSVNQAYGYGNAGYNSGMMGQNLGIMGGQQYGQMGANYGQQSADIGQMGLRAEQTGQNITNQSQDYARQQAMAGQQYARQATDPNAIAQYMNPYTQNVADVQTAAAQRAFDVAQTQRQATAAKSSAYGGSRQAIENAEAQRALQSQMQAIQATGQQTAYDKALQNMQYGSSAGLQGLSGAQTGLGTALQGGQLGLSGIGTALQGLQGGMQGAGVGLQGVNAQLAGTAQGMQGAQTGLQGVSGAQAGYNLANTAGQNLANIGQNQLAAQQAIINMQNTYGQQQQTQQQNIINNAINNYATAQQYPQQQLAFYNSLLRGYSTPTTTTSQYQAAPSAMSQLSGLGLTGAAAYGLMKKKGGVIKDKKKDGVDTLGLYNVMKESA
jgi:hypothetical protein